MGRKNAVITGGAEIGKFSCVHTVGILEVQCAVGFTQDASSVKSCGETSQAMTQLWFRCSDATRGSYFVMGNRLDACKDHSVIESHLSLTIDFTPLFVCLDSQPQNSLAYDQTSLHLASPGCWATRDLLDFEARVSLSPVRVWLSRPSAISSFEALRGADVGGSASATAMRNRARYRLEAEAIPQRLAIAPDLCPWFTSEQRIQGRPRPSGPVKFTPCPSLTIASWAP